MKPTTETILTEYQAAMKQIEEENGTMFGCLMEDYRTAMSKIEFKRGAKNPMISSERSLVSIAMELERIRRVLEKIERRLEHEEEITRGGRAELPAESEG